MRQYKKRIIAISLASVMTVLGAFGAENYKNTVMSMDFGRTTNGIKLTIYTQNNYSTPLKYTKENKSYEIILNETNYNPALQNKQQWPPEVVSVNMSTTPYTPDSTGSTKIRITLADDMPFQAKTALYLPNSTSPTNSITDKQSGTAVGNTTKTKQNYNSPKKSYWDDDEKSETVVVKKETPAPVKVKTENPTTVTEPEKNTTNTPANNKQETIDVRDYEQTYDSDPRSRLFAVIGIMVIALIIMFLIFWSKERMAALTGDQSKYDFGDSDNKKQDTKHEKRLKSNIPPQKDVYTKPEIEPNIDNNIPQETDEEEEVNVIDLDELYNKTAQQNNTPVEETPEVVEEDSNSDLDDFLSEFSFDEETVETPAETEQIQEEIEPFDEQLYEKCINDNELSFTTSDIEKINSLLQNEISDESMQKRIEYLHELEEKRNAPTKEQLLEEFIATYFVKQNISFTNEDVSALQKLMNVELDENFVKDLHTNPIRTRQMYNELSKKDSQPHKVTETKTLKVKNLLPNLSEELKKYGNKRIPSNAKPQVVYFSEGYEYTKLKVDSTALDLTNTEQNYFRPSDMPNIVENGYEVQTLSVKNILPDLNDVKAHPSKYQEPEKEKPVADEDALLNSIANVTFKPFYEEAPAFENTYESNASDNLILDLDKMAKDMAAESFTFEPVVTESDKISENEIINENKQETIKNIAPPMPKEPSENKIEKQVQITEERTQTIPEYPQICNYEGETYRVIKVATCSDQAGCYLAKSDNGYTVFGFIKNKLYKLNSYDELKSENIQLRINEKKEEGSAQYIVKVSTHKFLMQLFSDKMELVMNLC